MDADKFFGLTVILAARIAAQARADDILVSGALADQASADEFEALGERELVLKGISEPQRSFTLGWRAEATG